MKTLRYYEDIDNHVLLAYEKSTEFFVQYIPKTKQWVDCNISFSNFQHDYYFIELSEEEALQKTNGNLAGSKFQEYLDMLNKNSGQ